MAIKDKAALKAESATIFASAKPGGILAVDHRTYNTDDIDSQLNLAETTEQTMSGDLNLGANNINNVGVIGITTINATNANFTNLSTTNITSNVNFNTNDITNLNALTVVNLTATNVLSDLDFQTTNSIIDANAIGCVGLTATNINCTDLKATMLGAALDANNQNITGGNLFSSTTGTFTTLNATNLGSSINAATFNITGASLLETITLEAQQLGEDLDAMDYSITNVNNDVDELELVLTAKSTASSQSPSGTNNPMQIEFGAAQTGGDVEIDVNGTITFKVAGESYLIKNVYMHTRSNDNNASILIFWHEDGAGVESPESVVNAIDDANTRNIINYDVVISPALNEEIKFYAMRDSTGNNSGDLEEFEPNSAAANDAPCAVTRVYRVKSLQ